MNRCIRNNVGDHNISQNTVIYVTSTTVTTNYKVHITTAHHNSQHYGGTVCCISILP